MNKSGVSVAEAVNFYKLDGSQILVFYDELDLPPGKLRMRRDGGLAGHNGLRSIKAHMGTDFRRARLGIGHPGHKDKVSGHVLGDFAKADQDWLAAFLKALCDNAPLAVEGEDATYQTRVVEAMKAVLPEPPKAASLALASVDVMIGDVCAVSGAQAASFAVALDLWRSSQKRYQ